MTSEEIYKALRDHEARLSRLEASIKSKPPTNQKKPADRKKNLAEHIIDLRDSAFFSQPRVAEEVHKKLLDIYYCELKRVGVALLRLTRRRALRRAKKIVNGKEYQAYVQ